MTTATIDRPLADETAPVVMPAPAAAPVVPVAGHCSCVCTACHGDGPAEAHCGNASTGCHVEPRPLPQPRG